MYDIARKAGVSQTAVSFVLNDHPQAKHLSQETRDKIFSAAKKLDYRPNLAAKSLSTGKSHTVTLTISNTDELTCARMAGFEKRLRKDGYMANIIFASRTEEENDNDFFDNLIKSNPAGVVFFPTDPAKASRCAKKLKKMNIPCVALGINAPGIDSIFIDRSIGVVEAVVYLYERGYKRVAYLGIQEESRLKGYKAALKLHKQTPIFLSANIDEIDPVARGRLATEEFLKMDKRPDAILCHTDKVALGFMQELHRRGIRIPEEVAIVGFNDVMAASTSYPPLTTIAQPKEETGTLLAEVILRKINGDKKQLDKKRDTLPTKLIIRETT